MSDDDRPLPDRIRKALDAVVNRPGRVATAAHPDCICGKPDPQNVTRYGDKKDCPQHRPEKP